MMNPVWVIFWMISVQIGFWDRVWKLPMRMKAYFDLVMATLILLGSSRNPRLELPDLTQLKIMMSFSRP